MAPINPNAQTLEGSIIRAETGMLEVIKAFDNHEREGLQKTPYRYIKFLKEFMSVPDFQMTVFEGENYDEMIIETGIEFYSLCEHHLAPFFGTAAVAYIPNQKIVGLSKLARVVDHFSRRFQNQERITTQVAEYIWEALSPKGVAVTLSARHMCVEMRGVKKPGVVTTTSKMMGAFKDDINCRQEFLSLISKK